MSSETGDLRPTAPKLPLWSTIRLSYSAYFEHFSDVLRASWVWLIIVALIGGGASWLQWSTLAETMQKIQRGARPEEMFLQHKTMLTVSFVSNLPHLVLIVAAVSVAVAWHRCLILGEQPALSGSNLISRDLWRYVGTGLAICLIVVVPVLLVTVPAVIWLPSAMGASSWARSVGIAVFILFFILYLAAIAVFLRLSPLLPARAAGNRDLTLAQTWRRTRGNTWRIFWGIVACILPGSLLMQALFFSVIGVPDAKSFVGEAVVVRMTIFSTVNLLWYLLILPLWIGFLSHAYLHFFDQASRR